jgi:hypothetical protein
MADSNQHIDKTPPAENVPPVERAPGRAAAEAARVGLEDHSEDVGATTQSDHMAAGGSTTANDPDALPGQAKVVGEEAVGGTTPTPDQSDVDAVATAAGVNTRPEHPVKVTEEMHKRDQHRHELDPESKGPAASA